MRGKSGKFNRSGDPPSVYAIAQTSCQGFLSCRASDGVAPLWHWHRARLHLGEKDFSVITTSIKLNDCLPACQPSHLCNRPVSPHLCHILWWPKFSSLSNLPAGRECRIPTGRGNESDKNGIEADLIGVALLSWTLDWEFSFSLPSCTWVSYPVSNVWNNRINRS